MKPILFAIAGVLLSLAGTGAGSADRFSRSTWLSDYAYLKTHLESSYSHLAWFASPESGVDLPRLDLRTRRSLQAAESDEEARAAILAFVASFHDGHFSPAPVLERAGSTVAPPKPDLDALGPAEGCAALGYVPVRSIAFTLPFDALRGFALETDGVARAFRAGTATSLAGTRIGIVRIPRFRDQDAPPSACVEVLTALRKAGASIDANAVRQKVADAWFRSLAAQLQRFRQEHVAAVIVDVGGNTGGNDSGDWAARLFTERDVHSAPLLVTAAQPSNAYFDEQLNGLREALEGHPGLSPSTRQELQAAQSAFEQRKASLASRICDMSWVWRERHPFKPGGCSRLVEAGYASGHKDYLAPNALGDKDVAGSLYWAAAVDEFRGAWAGPVYLLTDGKTASSAEMFAAVMRDNAIARTVGERTEGDGCGFMYENAPLELPASRLRFRIPNCVRLRADGTDEVAGIAADLPILPREGEDARSRAARLLESVDADLRTRAAPAQHP
jgi:hypothetical protein